MNPPATYRTRRGSRFVTALATSLALVVAPLSLVSSQAAFLDEAWSSAKAGTLDCAAPEGQIVSRGYGRLLDGSLLPVNLDAVAKVSGVTALSDGSSSQVEPTSSQPVGEDAYVNPLGLDVLSLIELPIGDTPLDDFLELDLNNAFGVINQYAASPASGQAAGAAGIINNSGAIQTSADTGGEIPTLATLKLSSLVEALTGTAVSSLVSGISDVSLEVGAVAGRASTDGCTQLWGRNSDAVLREYAIAGLAAEIDSPAVRGLSTGLTTTLVGLETTVNNLLSNEGVVELLLGGISNLIGGVLQTLKLGSLTVGGTIDVDLSAARALTTANISDDNGLVSLDLSSGTVSIDLAALLGEAYSGVGFAGDQEYGLNGLGPNTSLLLNPQVLNALAAALTSALDAWVSDVVGAVELSLNLATVDLNVAIPLLSLVSTPLATINADVEGSLTDLLSGDAKVSTTVNLIGNVCIELITCLVTGVLNPVLKAVLESVLGLLTGGLAPALGTILQSVLFSETSVLRTLGSTLTQATGPVITLLTGVLDQYLGIDGLVSVRANLQNRPTGATAPTYPDWETGPDAVGEGRYAIGALGISVLDALGANTNANLEFGRGEVGPICLVGSPACPEN